MADVFDQLRDFASHVSASPPPMAEVRARARRQRRWRTIPGTALALATVIVVVVAVALAGGTSAHLAPGNGSAHRPPPTVAQLLAGSWSTIPAAPIAPRQNASIVWTGQELVVWGGASGASDALLSGDGAAYDPSTHRWQLLPASPLPPTAGASAVWTGREMVIFGGYVDETPGHIQVTNAAAAYTPSTNSWRVLPNAPLSARASPLGVWTGTTVIELGGVTSGQDPGDGAAFDPTSDTWRHIKAPDAPVGQQFLSWQVAVQAGGQIVGLSSFEVNSFEVGIGTDVFGYDETTLKWRWMGTLDSVAAPEQAMWTGPDLRGLIVRGGPRLSNKYRGPQTAKVTGIYDLETDKWTPIPDSPLGHDDPLAFDDPTSIWAGDALVSFDSDYAYRTGVPGDASLYNPVSARWSVLRPAPFGCGASTSLLWTGQQIMAYCPHRATDSRPASAGLVYTPAGRTQTTR
jgi:hypothetical protein